MNEVIFQNENHKNILVEEYGNGMAVQANVHMIIHGDEAIILDPGGHKVFNKAMSNVSSAINIGKLKYLFFSHQDPDIVAAANGWLMSTDAVAWCPQHWMRFIPHFGVDKLVGDRLRPIPDEGMVLDLAGCQLKFIPAHFMHSIANFHVYDPESRILYSGDLGASLGMSYSTVEDFDSHIKYMESFHKRYMVCNSVLQHWAQMVRTLDIEVIAPQHGAMFKGKELVNKMIDWCENLQCGIDLMKEVYKIP